MLLLHGTGSGNFSWRGMLPELAEHFTVIAPDLPGHAFTSRGPDGALSLPGMAEGLRALMLQLQLTPQVIVGHSAGAAIAAHMALHFDQRRFFDQRALVHAVFKAVAHFGRFDFGGKLGGEGFVDRFLHIDAVGAHTGLTRIAVFAGEGAFDGAVDVGVFKHDERRVAAQLQRHFFYGGCRLGHQDAAHFG